MIDGTRGASAWWQHYGLLVWAGIVPAALGLLVGNVGPVAGVGVLAIATGLIVFRHPEVGVLLIAVTVPLENAVMFEGATATRLLSLVAVVAWLGNRLVWGADWKPLIQSPFVLASAAFISFALVSALWAWLPSVTLNGAIGLAQLFAWAVMIADIVRNPAATDRLVKVLVLGGSAAAILTIQQAFFLGLRRAGADVGGGINGTATILVTLIPFGFYLFRADPNIFWRLAGFAYVALAAVAIPVTLSRMNLLMLIGVLVVMSTLTWLTGGGRRWVALLVLTMVMVGGAVVPWQRITSRAESILPYLRATTSVTNESPFLSGRGYHIRVGLAILRDRPILGAGYRNYGHFFLRDYQYRVPGSDRIYRSPRSPHSSYVGILADLGVVGLALWLLVTFGAGLGAAVRAWSISNRMHLTRTRFLAQSVFVAFGLHALPYGLYLPNQEEKLFWVLLALTFAVHQLAMSESRTNDTKRGRAELPKISGRLAVGVSS